MRRLGLLLPEPRRLVKFMAFAAMLLMAGLLVTTLYWSREPKRFDVTGIALARIGTPAGEDAANSLPPGYTLISTQMHLVENLLNKPGGYFANDKLPPGAWMDNLPSWEFGVLTQIRDFNLALRMDLSRANAQSVDRPELNNAQTSFAFSHEAWMLPSAESEYRNGLNQLGLYAAALTNETAVFTIRANALDGWLHKVERRLGACSLQLRANAGADQYNSNIMTSIQDQAGKTENTSIPRTQIDNVFYEARGAAWAIYHLMKGVKHDYEPVLDQMLAMGAMNRALSNLYAALEPLRSPMVLNGEDFGATPNHSLILAAYLANAHLAVSELRGLLRNA